jgi:hypothetical protein
MPVTAIESWHDFGRTRDHDALRAALDPDVVFESPVVHMPQHGRDVTLRYLAGAVAVLGTPDFRYVNEWRNANGAVLEFENMIDGTRINGVDIITTNADGTLITRFKVMIRPLKAVNLLHQLMGEQLTKR